MRLLQGCQRDELTFIFLSAWRGCFHQINGCWNVSRRIIVASSKTTYLRMGHKQKSKLYRLMSALPPKADIGTWSRNVCFVPKADIVRCGEVRRYSITSSARASRVDGMVNSSALAVVRLISSSNFVGNSIGRSPGLAPLRILSTKLAVRRQLSRRFVP
jgi:hypothetical protein